MGNAAGGGGAGAASIATLGFSVAGDLMKGAGAQSAADAKAARLEQAAQYGRVAAQQTDAQLTEQLNTTLGNIDAIRAAANTDPSSPTGNAIRSSQEYVGDRQRTTTVNNIVRQANQNDADAKYTRAAGDYALKMGYVSAGLDVAKAAASKFAMPGS